ncbi:MAG: molecular chaperone DnaJ [Acidobacteriota bacterium]
MAKRDYYEVLGIPKTAAPDEIKKAYRAAALKYHPDVAENKEEAEVQMKEINEAYAVLSDDQKRRQYDQFGHAAFDPSQGGGGFDFDFDIGGVGDLFDMFFGGGGGRRRRNGPQRGADREVQIEIEFEDAAFGAEKDIQIPRIEECETCSGSGAEPGSSPKTCTTCNGQGQVRSVQSTPFGRFETVKACARCNGSGKMIEKPCKTCGGAGRVRKNRRVTVRVPAGVDNGSKLRMQGEGEAGARGGPNGDLYVYLIVRPHKIFKRQNYDVLNEVNISFVQAALGDDIEVPTLEGKTKLTIPEGTQTGTHFTLRGKGIPHIRGNRRGDQLVFVKVATPTKLNDKQKELLRKFGEEEDHRAESAKKGIFDKVKDAFSG